MVNGRSDREASRITVEQLKLPMTVEEFAEKRMECLLKIFPRAATVPGVERIVKRIHEMGIPMAVATSCQKNAHEAKLLGHKELFSMFQATVCGDEVQHSKPSPEIFETAARKLGDYKPENVLVFEDAVNGVKAANAAGMACVLLRSNSLDPGDDIHPNLIIDSFDKFDFDSFLWGELINRQ